MGQAAQVSVVLADVVANALTARGLTTLRARAAFVDIKPTTLARYLKAQRPMKPDAMAKVASALGMTLSELAGLVDEALA